MEVDVTTAITIFRPCDSVAAYAADPDHASNWYGHIRSVEWRSVRPLTLGSQVAFVARCFGCRLTFPYEVVE